MIIKLSLIFLITICAAILLAKYIKFISYGHHRARFRVSGLLESRILSECGIQEGYQTWQGYLLSALYISLVALVISFFVFVFQGHLPLNPQGYSGLSLSFAFNIAVSFVTTTNWQEYQGEITLSHLSHMILTVVAFVSTTTGMCCGIALIKALCTERSHDRSVDDFGNFWVDFIRILLFVLFPTCLIIALIFIACGIVQNFSEYTSIVTLAGAKQIIPQGPIAAFESISIFGVNGGGLFGANSGHPFENPTPLTNLLQMILMLVIPSSIIFLYGEIIGKTSHAWLIIVLVNILLFIGVINAFEGNMNIAEPGYVNVNMEGKEQRFGVVDTTIFHCLAAATSGASSGNIESFNPKSHIVFLSTILFGGAILGGAGSGICNLLIFVIMAVFFAGLMSGRTPRFLGRSVGFAEVRLITIYFVVTQCILMTCMTFSLLNGGLASSVNSESFIAVKQIAFTYAASMSNNGMGLGDYIANDTFLNLSTAGCMLLGRIAVILCAFKVVDSLCRKKIMDAGIHDVQVDHWFFAFLIFFAMFQDFLVFIPIIIMGPVMEFVVYR